MEIPVPFGSLMGLPGPIGLGKSHSDWFISINVRFISINVHVLKRSWFVFISVYVLKRECIHEFVAFLSFSEF